MSQYTKGLGGRLFIATRYRHAMFSREAAEEFAALFTQTPLGG